MIARQTAPDGKPWWLRWIVLHMIEEYARHNGHADLLRESIDRRDRRVAVTAQQPVAWGSYRCGTSIGGLRLGVVDYSGRAQVSMVMVAPGEQAAGGDPLLVSRAVLMRRAHP